MGTITKVKFIFIATLGKPKPVEGIAFVWISVEWSGHGREMRKKGSTFIIFKSVKSLFYPAEWIFQHFVTEPDKCKTFDRENLQIVIFCSEHEEGN